MGGTWRQAAALALSVAAAVVLVELIGNAGGRLSLHVRGTVAHGEGAAAGKAFPRSVTDDAGRVVTVPAPPQRIVSNSITVDGLLFEVVEAHRIVAVSPFSMDPRYSDVAAKAAPHGAATSVSPEVSLRLRPDLVFAGIHARSEWLSLMEHSGAPIYSVGDRILRIDDLLDLVRRIGYLTGNEQSADRVVESWTARLDKLRKRSLEPGKAPPRVLGYDKSLSYSYGHATLFHDVLTVIGATNVGAEHGLESYDRISTEEIAAWNPEWIVTGADPGERDGLERGLLEDPGIAVTTAARSGQIVILPKHVFLTTSHNVVKLAESISRAIYGEDR